MERLIRAATVADIPAIMQVLRAAKGIMRATGNLNQWQGDYPAPEDILNDMRRNGARVVEDDGRVTAYFAFLPSPEPTYNHIYHGQWLDDALPYHVVHRMGSYPDVHNIFSDVMDYCFTVSPNIRIDTHRDNTVMQHCILGYGFVYCGIILLANGDERLAYQRIETPD